MVKYKKVKKWRTVLTRRGQLCFSQQYKSTLDQTSIFRKLL